MKVATPYFAFVFILILALPIAFAGTGFDRVPSDGAGFQNDLSIAENRFYERDSLNVVGCYLNDDGLAIGCYSSDGGQRWETTDLPEVWRYADHASVACDLNGFAYVCYRSHDGKGSSGVFVSKSFDGGRWWEQPVAIDSLAAKRGRTLGRVERCAISIDTCMSSGRRLQPMASIQISISRCHPTMVNRSPGLQRSTMEPLS